MWHAPTLESQTFAYVPILSYGMCVAVQSSGGVGLALYPSTQKPIAAMRLRHACMHVGLPGLHCAATRAASPNAPVALVISS